MEYGGGAMIVTEPPPARLRKSGITVAEVLKWMAAGESESDIVLHHPSLNREEIRASLAYAAERELQATNRLAASFTSHWTGKFTLPEAGSEDTRLIYLLDRYERGGR